MADLFMLLDEQEALCCRGYLGERGMRIGIAVDSSCDLPLSYYKEHDIMMFPITLRVRDAVLEDYRNERLTLEFLDTHIVEYGARAETRPPQAQELKALFMRDFVRNYDYGFCLTIAHSRSPAFELAQEAGALLAKESIPLRQALGVQSPFALRVVDTQNVFTGQAIPTVEAVRMRSEGASLPRMRARLEEVALNTHTYVVPKDLYYLRARTRHRGDRSVSLLSASLGTMLDIKPIIHCNRGQSGPLAKVKTHDAAVQKVFDFALRHVQKGLMTPTLCLSYGGPLAEMQQHPGYEALKHACAKKGVEVFETIMSLVGMANVGKGTLVLSFAADEVGSI